MKATNSIQYKKLVHSLKAIYRFALTEQNNYQVSLNNGQNIEPVVVTAVLFGLGKRVC
jgi:hypothetical protein